MSVLEADHSPQSSADIKNAWTYTFILSSSLWHGAGRNLFFCHQKKGWNIGNQIGWLMVSVEMQEMHLEFLYGRIFQNVHSGDGQIHRMITLRWTLQR
jgi:hypothetical protein